jgi:NADH-quinone oxidoreductase subunit E
MGENICLQSDANLLLASNGFAGRPDELIALLQFFQRKQGYISSESVAQIAQFLRMSESHIFGVASFYTQFRFEKPGEHTIRVCLGTACHVQGGEQLSQEIQKILGVLPGETTPDQRFDLQEVACLGCCAQAPVVEIDGKIYGKMTTDQLRTTLKEYENI